MRKLKRLVTTVFIAAFIVAMAGIMPVSADGILYGDINNDGSVNLMDCICINKYLKGRCDLLNYETADVNCSYTIDIVDSDILTAYTVGNINVLPYLQ
ncbi:MAG: dockerin type I domain-containing protein [Oscillospiraceae bacterium]|nr:dockerin type I domain-containing protein [Oscillospiraceae bacterium]